MRTIHLKFEKVGKSSDISLMGALRRGVSGDI